MKVEIDKLLTKVTLLEILDLSRDWQAIWQDLSIMDTKQIYGRKFLSQQNNEVPAYSRESKTTHSGIMSAQNA
jgi:beta-glucanase (GH16 family)